MERFVVAVGYEVLAACFLAGLVRRVGLAKHVEKCYDWLYFLKITLSWVILIQIGFTVLVSVMFWHEDSLAVGLTALIGIPMTPLLTMFTMLGFARTYRAVPNIIKRLERMTPDERENELENLPPEVFAQLPGDYRFVSKKNQ